MSGPLSFICSVLKVQVMQSCNNGGVTVMFFCCVWYVLYSTTLKLNLLCFFSTFPWFQRDILQLKYFTADSYAYLAIRCPVHSNCFSSAKYHHICCSAVCLWFLMEWNLLLSSGCPGDLKLYDSLWYMHAVMWTRFNGLWLLWVMLAFSWEIYSSWMTPIFLNESTETILFEHKCYVRWNLRRQTAVSKCKNVQTFQGLTLPPSAG
jgi:hypothetical protein